MSTAAIIGASAIVVSVVLRSALLNFSSRLCEAIATLGTSVEGMWAGFPASSEPVIVDVDKLWQAQATTGGTDLILESELNDANAEAGESYQPELGLGLEY